MLFRVVGPFAFGYFLSYLFRVVNAVAGPELVGEVGIDAGSLGLLTSVYFLAFAAVQLPLGIALDRFGPRLVESLLLLVAAAGALVFAQAGDLGGLVLGRALIGVGVAACLMAAFKAYAAAIPAERLPFVNGIHLAAGGLGALAGGAPSNLMIELVGWRGLFLALAVLSVVASALIALFGPRWSGAPGERLAQQARAVGAILTDPAFLRVAPLCIASQATAMGISGLWAGPWLRDVYGLDPAGAATVLSVMAVCLVAGFLGFGTAATRLAARGVPTLWVMVAGIAAFMVVQVLLVVLPRGGGPPTWAAYAFLGSAGILGFPVLTVAFGAHLAGRVNTALNFLVFTASFAVQWLVGVALDLLGPSLGLKGGFDAAFLGLLTLEGLALIWLLARPSAVRRAPSAPGVAGRSEAR